MNLEYTGLVIVRYASAWTDRLPLEQHADLNIGIDTEASRWHDVLICFIAPDCHCCHLNHENEYNYTTGLLLAAEAVRGHL